MIDDVSGDCTVCPLECPDEDEVLDLLLCECVTCASTCDDFNECTNDTCVAGECQNELFEDCAKCLNITNCDNCRKRPECTWVNCDEPGLVFGNGTIVKLTDLELEAVNAELLRIKEERCERAQELGDEEAALTYCEGLASLLCVEAISDNNVDAVFGHCNLTVLCPEAEANEDVVFYQKFCREGADGTLTSDAQLIGNDESGRRHNVRMVRHLTGRSLASSGDYGTDITIEVDGVDLNVTDVAEELARDENRCIPVVLNNTLDCRGVDCSSVDNQITATTLSIGLAVGGAASAGSGIAFFGAAWGLAAFRQGAGTPLDIPESEFDATNAFVDDGALYDNPADAMFSSSLFEALDG